MKFRKITSADELAEIIARKTGNEKLSNSYYDHLADKVLVKENSYSEIVGEERKTWADSYVKGLT